jgi:hypothetical protein
MGAAGVQAASAPCVTALHPRSPFYRTAGVESDAFSVANTVFGIEP